MNRTLFPAHAAVLILIMAACGDAPPSGARDSAPPAQTEILAPERIMSRGLKLDRVTEITFFETGRFSRQIFSEVGFGPRRFLGEQRGDWSARPDGTLCTANEVANIDGFSTGNCFRIRASGDRMSCDVSWGGKRYRTLPCRFLDADRSAGLAASSNAGRGTPDPV